MTTRDCHKVVRWFRRSLGLREWTINLAIGESGPPGRDIDGDPGRLGQCWPELRAKTATIWVSPDRCRLAGIDPIRVLCHELWHVCLCEAGVENAGDDRSECLWDQLDPILCEAYTHKCQT